LPESAILISGDYTMEQTSGNLYQIMVKEPIDPCWSDWLNNIVVEL